MNVCVLGTGYVGLVSGVCLAEVGHQVTCVDVDAEKVRRINHGESPIYENGLDEMLVRNVGKRLKATTDTRSAVLGAELTLIAVGTPFDGERIDLSYVKRAAEEIGGALGQHPGHPTVVVKSTVVPGTTDKVVLPILESASGKRAGSDFGVGMNPEFLTEGEAVGDFMNPDRIVVGGIDAKSQDAQLALYAPFKDADVLRTSNSTAEMIKYASNSLLATLISFSNELANLGTSLGGIDIVEVMQGLHMSRYLSPLAADGSKVTPAINAFLMAGCGFGGSCLPKDVSALVAHGRSVGLPMELLKAVIDINKRQPQEVFRLLGKHFPSLSGKRVSVLGLAFRPDTNDVRESPAIPIVKKLLDEGARVAAYDPVAAEEARRVLPPGVEYRASIEQAIDGAEAVILVTRWREFERVPALLSALPSPPIFIDGRRMLDRKAVPNYEGIGA